MKIISMSTALALMMAVAVNGENRAVIIECNEHEKEVCAQYTNRSCYNHTVSGYIECGYCLNGYIEIYGECHSIDEITSSSSNSSSEEESPLLNKLLKDFIPDYAWSHVPRSRRILRFIEMASLISLTNSKIPPRTFSLGINSETFLTLEERMGRLGARVREGDVSVRDELRRFSGNGNGGNGGNGINSIQNGKDYLSNSQMKMWKSTERSLQDNIPAFIDWVSKGACTRVKQQGLCGCCWAVSTAAAVESALIITNVTASSDTPDADSLSFQQMVSCDKENNGCNGGDILYATKYAWENNNFNNGDLGGLVSYSEYPYEDMKGTTTTTCNVAGKTPRAYLNEPQVVTSVNDRSSFEERRDLVKAAVAQQPVTTVMRSGCDLLMSYRKGVLTEDGLCQCCEASCIDHAVVIVGYDTTANPPYWKVRNSWGSFWGEEGYFRVAMDSPGCGWGLFGIVTESSLPGDVYSNTADLSERPGWWAKSSGWEKALVIIASILGFLVLCSCCYGIYYEKVKRSRASEVPVEVAVGNDERIDQSEPLL